MKKLSVLVACMAMMIFGLANSVMAQEPEQKNPFLGDWVIEMDTPMGLVEMNANFTEKDNKMAGTVTTADTGDQVIEMYDVTWDGQKQLDFGIFSQGYDVPFTVTLKDDGTLQGVAMNMMNVTGHRKEAAEPAK